MTLLQILFLLTALVTFAAAFRVVTSPRMIHAGLWLILALAGVAVLLVLLDAGFLAVVQVLVYIGAIAILIIFALMLTRHVMGESGSQVNQLWWAAAVAALLLFIGLAFAFSITPSVATLAPALPADQTANLEDLGRSLVDINRYVLPFEVASILLLAAMVGAIYIARPLGSDEGEREE